MVSKGQAVVGSGQPVKSVPDGDKGECKIQEGPRNERENVRTRPLPYRPRPIRGTTHLPRIPPTLHFRPTASLFFLSLLALILLLFRVDLSDAQSGPGVSGGNPYYLPAAPTLGAWGTLPTVVGTTPASFAVNVGTGGTASTGVVNLPTALHGWACSSADVTNAAGNLTQQTASATNSATFTNFVRTTGVAGPWNASDIVQIDCWPN